MVIDQTINKKEITISGYLFAFYLLNEQHAVALDCLVDPQPLKTIANATTNAKNAIQLMIAVSTGRLAMTWVITYE